MNFGYNNSGCGCNYAPSYSQAYGPYQPYGGFGCGCGTGYGFGGGSSWFAIVLVVFLLLIICGCCRVC